MAAPSGRTYEPIFLQGTLCERVIDEADGHEFYLCHAEVTSDDLTCRCTAKDGRWFWYCTEPH